MFGPNPGTEPPGVEVIFLLLEGSKWMVSKGEMLLGTYPALRSWLCDGIVSNLCA